MTAGGEPRLITIPISHYCEKARWALDRAGIRYREERHLQGVHRFVSRRAGGAGTTPVLVTEAGVLGESHDIVAWADARMPPEMRVLPDPPAERAEVERLCRRFDEILGPRGRRLIYVRVFPQRELALAFNNNGLPAWEDRVSRTAWPLLERGLRMALGITAGIEREDERVVFEELDFAAGLLADGRPYLLGERFTAADLTFAALSSPLVCPPEYGIPLPPPGLFDTTTAELVRRAREHPAGSHALAMFARHRHEHAAAAITP